MIIAFRTIYSANIICDSEKKLKKQEISEKNDFFSLRRLFLRGRLFLLPLLYTLLSEDDDKMMLPLVEAVRHAEPIVAAY